MCLWLTMFELTTSNGDLLQSRTHHRPGIQGAARQHFLSGSTRWTSARPGWVDGVRSLSLALQSPLTPLWATDAELATPRPAREFSQCRGHVTNIHRDPGSCDVKATPIRSNPPIRSEKKRTHAMLKFWLPRLDTESDAWLVSAQSRVRLAACTTGSKAGFPCFHGLARQPTRDVPRIEWCASDPQTDRSTDPNARCSRVSRRPAV
jgi:hypothetical protein